MVVLINMLVFTKSFKFNKKKIFNSIEIYWNFIVFIRFKLLLLWTIDFDQLLFLQNYYYSYFLEFVHETTIQKTIITFMFSDWIFFIVLNKHLHCPTTGPLFVCFSVQKWRARTKWPWFHQWQTPHQPHAKPIGGCWLATMYAVVFIINNHCFLLVLNVILNSNRIGVHWTIKNSHSKNHLLKTLPFVPTTPTGRQQPRVVDSTVCWWY